MTDHELLQHIYSETGNLKTKINSLRPCPETEKLKEINYTRLLLMEIELDNMKSRIEELKRAFSPEQTKLV